MQKWSSGSQLVGIWISVSSPEAITKKDRENTQIGTIRNPEMLIIQAVFSRFLSPICIA